MTRHAVFLPPFNALADPRLLAELAAAAENAGWDGFFLWDHMLYSEPVESLLDPWISLAAIGSATSTIQLGPMVTPLPRRRPAVVARQAATLDVLTRGRLVLGLGLGDDGRVGELSRFGEQTDARTRAAMLDEGIEVVRQLLSGDEVEHRGEHYIADGVRFLPRPWNDRNLPIWLAGRWPYRNPLRRAARYDGVFVIAIESLDAARELLDVLRTERGSLDGFDVVLEPPAGDDVAEWAALPGVTWLLRGVGVRGLDVDQVRAMIEAGPPPS